jgi:hypothetical protein
MPYKLYPIVNNKILLQYAIGTYTVDDINGANQEALAFLEKQTEPIYLLLDQTRTSRIEIKAGEARKAGETLFKHPMVKSMIVYGSPDGIIAGFITKFLTSLFKLPMKHFRTEEDAINYIIKVDPSLDEILQREVKLLNALNPHGRNFR